MRFPYARSLLDSGMSDARERVERELLGLTSERAQRAIAQAGAAKARAARKKGLVQLLIGVAAVVLAVVLLASHKGYITLYTPRLNAPDRVGSWWTEPVIFALGVASAVKGLIALLSGHGDER